MKRHLCLLALVLPLAGVLPAPSQTAAKPLFNGVNLDGWEVRGNGVWEVLPGGILLGHRAHSDPVTTHATSQSSSWPITEHQYNSWRYRQAWLYSTTEYGEFDLHVEYFVPVGGNSGVSIRDQSRAHTAIGEDDAVRPELAKFPKSTPAHVGYEIQILANDGDEKYQTGSIYGLVAARTGPQRAGDWNDMDIESRNNLVRVRVNGEVVSEGPGDPARPKRGPIGLQLHDQFTFMMFRNILIKEK
jgi:Domain of Unknown Function (DUF1080)